MGVLHLLLGVLHLLLGVLHLLLGVLHLLLGAAGELWYHRRGGTQTCFLLISFAHIYIYIQIRFYIGLQ